MYYWSLVYVYSKVLVMMGSWLSKLFIDIGSDLSILLLIFVIMLLLGGCLGGSGGGFLSCGGKGFGVLGGCICILGIVMLFIIFLIM